VCHLGASVTHLPWGYTLLWSPAKSGMGPSASQNGPFWRSEMPCGHGNWIKLLLGAHPKLCWELEGFFFSFFSRSQCVPFLSSQWVPNMYSPTYSPQHLILIPYALANCCPPFTHMGGPKGRNSILQNSWRPFYLGEPP